MMLKHRLLLTGLTILFNRRLSRGRKRPISAIVPKTPPSQSPTPPALVQLLSGRARCTGGALRLLPTERRLS
jgi:hypothetical protein